MCVDGRVKLSLSNAAFIIHAWYYFFSQPAKWFDFHCPLTLSQALLQYPHLLFRQRAYKVAHLYQIQQQKSHPAWIIIVISNGSRRILMYIVCPYSIISIVVQFTLNSVKFISTSSLYAVWISMKLTYSGWRKGEWKNHNTCDIHSPWERL